MTGAEKAARELREAVIVGIERVIAEPGAVVGKRGRGETRDHWAARAVLQSLTPEAPETGEE